MTRIEVAIKDKHFLEIQAHMRRKSNQARNMLKIIRCRGCANQIPRPFQEILTMSFVSVSIEFALVVRVKFR